MVDNKLSIEDILAKKKGVQKTVYIQIDGTMAGELEDLRERYVQAQIDDERSNEPDRAPAIKAELEDMLEAAEETNIAFTFKAIGRARYDALVEGHKPNAKQQKDGAQFNPETFPQALVAASCVDPEISKDQVDEMWASEEWGPGELLKLFFYRPVGEQRDG